MKTTLQHSRTDDDRALRKGLTLVELLVVIAIIGTLVALLLPAVQAARESARRVTCQNNLRQVALGVLNYASTNNDKFPSLWQTANFEPWENFSWRVDLLPYLESSSIHDSLKTDLPPLSTTNRPTVGTLISLFQCPSTPGAPRSIQSLGLEDDVWAGACDYSAIHDVANQEDEDLLPAAWRSKAKGEGEGAEDVAATPTSIEQDRYNPALRIEPGRLKMIGDGLSNTAMLVEQAGKPMQYDQARVAEVVDVPKEGAWATAEFSSFYASGVNRDNLTGLYGFHSGAVVAMCDGSVHLFAADMEVEVVTALLSRNGDEIIDADDWQ